MPDDEPDWDCPGCQGGDKWPVDQAVWRCPVCDTEYQDKDAPMTNIAPAENSWDQHLADCHCPTTPDPRDDVIARPFGRTTMAEMKIEHGNLTNCTIDLSGAGYDCVYKVAEADGSPLMHTKYGIYSEGSLVLLRTDKDGKSYLDANRLHILGPYALQKLIDDAVKAAVDAEREACSMICDEVARTAEEYDIPQMVMGANTVRDAIRTPTPNAGAVKVKPLVWEFCEDKYTAQTPMGQYTISYGAGFDGATVYTRHKGTRRAFKTVAEAKAAAQADYTARIMSAIEPTPAPRDDVIARLVDALTTIKDRADYQLPSAQEIACAALAAAKDVMK